MARNKTFNAFEDILGDDSEEVVVEVEDLAAPTSASEYKEEAPIEEKKAEQPKQQKTTNKVTKKKPIKITFDDTDSKGVPRTFVYEKDVSDALDRIVRTNNGKGKLKDGAKGFLSIFVNNAVTKELVEMGLLDESYLNDLIPYD